MIEIRPIQTNQIPEAKRLIVTVAQGTYQWSKPVDEMLVIFDKRGEFKDMDEVQSHYFENHGVFLAAMDGDQIIGTGAIRYCSETKCELKRLWLFDKYQGQGIGYRLITTLFEHARGFGYRTIKLLTDRRQIRAINFYRQVGFIFVEQDSDDPNDVFMEMSLE